MNKGQFVAKIKELQECSVKKSNELYDMFVGLIQAELLAGNTVALQGIGILKPKTRKARTGVNPQNGSKIEIPAKQTVAFTASKTIKDELN
jgi:DNA-binding protein HU-beta